MRSSTIAGAAALLALGGAPAHAQVFHAAAGDLTVETVAKGLDHPWALAFLPDGRLLVTERPGRMRIVARDGKLSPALAGVPKVFASGQGGLHDVIIDRGYGQNQTIYFCYAEPVGPVRAPRWRAPGWWTRAHPGWTTSRSFSSRTGRSRTEIISAAASCRRPTAISF